MEINNDNVSNIMQEYANKAYNYEEAFKILNRTQDEVDELRNIVKDFSVVPKSITDQHLLCFLFEGYSLNKSAERVKLYYELKVNNPHLFKDRDPESPEIQQCLKSQHYFYTPVTPDGHSVIHLSLIDFRASSFCFDAIVKTFVMICESCLIEQGPRKGLIFVVDMKGASLSHLTKPSIRTVITSIKFAFHACPILVSAVHILNAPSFFGLIIKMFLRPFINKEFKHMLFLHPQDIDWEEFYTNIVPKSSLPSDYGGDLESIEVMHEKSCNNLIKWKGYFEAESVQTYSTQKK